MNFNICPVFFINPLSMYQCIARKLFQNFLLPADFYFKISASKKLFQEYHQAQMSNNLDPDQARQNVEPDLGPNCLQRKKMH